jgi:cyclohexadienyl dehydratase
MNIPHQKITTALILSIVLMTQSAFADQLLPLVEQRLGYMQDVAAYKWRHSLPIENRERENVVLASAVRQGLRFGLTEDSSRQFFAVQIKAAKEVQAYWFKRWQAEPDSVPETTADLKDEIRPALLRLGERITAQLAVSLSDLSSLSTEGLSSTTAAQLNVAAKAVKAYPNRLSQILDTGTLRVGTTGDYAPFSYSPDSLPSSKTWRGIDIDLAQNLAASLGVEVRWVPTTWPDLMNDLHSGRYDIGMSGISISELRKETAFFSTPYFQGGKTPLIRCRDSEAYYSLKTIDTPHTRVIVNPGGTNQKFVNANIHRANILVHNDNRSIFDELISDRADVMITDQIEVKLQVALHPELCAAMGEQTLTFSEKAYLLPEDKAWKEAVDRWLDEILHQGTVKNLVGTHLATQDSI